MGVNERKNRFTENELEEIRKELIKRKADILQDAIRLQKDSLKKTFKDASGDLSGYSFHMADMATDLYEREFSLQLAEAERQHLYFLDDAIRRLDEGKYGICGECGCKIPKQRLKAIPEAEYCIECQEKQENK